MAGRRVAIWGGLAMAGAGGYYLYSAGGDPKVAKLELEHDAEVARAKLKGESFAPDAAKKQGQEFTQKVGGNIQLHAEELRQKVRDADNRIVKDFGKAENKLENFSKDGAAQLEKSKKEAGKTFNENVDKFDKTVEKKASEAKSGLSSWFGFGK